MQNRSFGAVKVLARLADERVEGAAVVAADALLELVVDVGCHLGVGVADLAHDPHDVEAVGEQGDRDVGAPEAVGRRVRQRRQPAVDETRRWLAPRLRGRFRRRAGGLCARRARSGRGRRRVGGLADAAQAVDVGDELLDEVGADLDLADAGLGLGVEDP